MAATIKQIEMALRQLKKENSDIVALKITVGTKGLLVVSELLKDGWESKSFDGDTLEEALGDWLNA